MTKTEVETSAVVDAETWLEPEEPIFRHSTDIARSNLPLVSPTEMSSLEPTITTPLSGSPSESTATSSDHVPSLSLSSDPTISLKAVTPTVSLAHNPLSPVPYLPPPGESIYRTIMNRLAALESNTTLYARYVSSQTAPIHALLRRLSEDIGRLEGLGRAQDRAFAELARQRTRAAVEQRALAARVAALADDAALEKRLGVAQLCLLLAVLVFLSVTRGSRSGELTRPVSAPRVDPARWVERLRTRSLTLAPTPALTPAPHANGVPFPTSTSTATSYAQGKRPPLQLHLPAELQSQMQRPRTPSRRRPHAHVVHLRATPASATPLGARATPRPGTGTRPALLQRSSSHGSAGQIVVPTALLVSAGPRSAKKWARTAHLHEVRPRESEKERERAVDASAAGRMDKAEEGLSGDRRGSKGAEDEGWWSDTDEEADANGGEVYSI